MALAAISSGTDENITLDAKGSGSVSLGATSTGDILLGGGSGSTGCTITNSTGAFACTAGGSFTTLTLTGAVTGAASYNGLVVTANTGVITTGTWNGTALTDAYVSDTLTASLFTGSGSTSTAVDLATAEVSGILGAANGGTGNGFTAFTGPTTSTKTFTLPNASATILTDNALVTVAQGGTGANTFTTNGVLYGNGTSAVQVTAAGTTGQCLTGNTSAAPSWGACGAGTVASGVAGYFGYYPSTGTTIDDQTVLFTNGTNIGIGDTTPAALLTVGSGDLFQIDSSGGLKFNGVTTDITTGTNEALLIAPNGTGSVIISSSVTSGSGSGSGLYATSSTVTSGAVITFSSTSDNTSGSTQQVLNVSNSGNSNGNLTYGASVSNSKSGSGINIALDLSATNGAANYALYAAAGNNYFGGNVGVGINAPTSQLHVQQAADSNNTSTPVAFDVNSAGATGELTGTAAQTFARIAPVINQSGAGGYTALLVNATETATGSAGKYLLDLQTGGVSKLSVQSDGTVTTASTIFGGNDIYAAASRYIGFNGRSVISSPADSNLLLQNSATNAFNLLIFGGATTSFPALKRSSATLQARLGDDSGYTSFDAANYLLSGTNINTAGTLNNVAYLNQANVFSANQTITKADPSLVLNATTATDTDFWMGVQDDAGGDDDDTFQIGDGTTPGTNPFLSIDTNGNVGIGDVTPDQKLEVLGSSSSPIQISIGNTSTGDPQIGFELADGTNTFTIGIDNSDSDKFKISGSALGTSDKLTIDSSGNGTFAGDLTVSGGNITNATTFDAGITIAAAQTITIGSDAIDEFVGTGLQLSSGDLQTVLGTTISGGEVDDDTLDYTDFEDTMDLDAALVLNQGANTWTQNFTGTTTTGLSYVANSLTTGTALSLASSSLTSGSLATIAVTGTGAASNTQKALNVSSAGTSANNQTTYTGYFANSTSGTDNTNIGLYAIANNAYTNIAGQFQATVAGGGVLNVGLHAYASTSASDYINLVLGSSVPATGNYSIYSSSTSDSYFAGEIGIGITNPSSALHVVAPAQTVASATSAEYTTGTFTSPTITLTGSTAVTTAMDSFLFNAPTIQDNDATQVAITNANSVTISSAPIAAGSTGVAITNAVGLRIGTADLTTGSGAVTNGYGLYIDAPTGATNNYGAVFTGGNVGIGTTSPTAFLHIGSNGAASNPGAKLSGSWFTGGDSTTTKPQLLVEASGATSTGWSTSGTGLGINAPSGFNGRIIDVKLNGTTAFSLNEAGGISTIGQGITNFSATSGYWYQPAATVSVGNNGDSGASNLLLRAGVSGSSGGNITFSVNNSTTGIWNSTGLGIGTGTPVDPLSISTAINASATHALFNLSNTALSSGSTNGTYIGANPASFTGNFFDFQVANTSVAKLTSGGALTVTSCTGCAGAATAFDAIGDPSGNGAINMGTTTQTLDWGATTTTDNLSITSSATGLTSGSALKVTSATTGAVTNGIVQLTASGAYTGSGGLLNVTGNATTGGVVQSVSGTGITTGTITNIAAGSGITSGAALKVSASGTSAIANGLVQISHSGAYTSTGGLLNVTSSASTAGTLVNLTNNTASFTGTALNISTTGITSGTGIQVTGGGSMAGGQLMGLVMGTASTGTALNISANGGAYTGTGLLAFNSNSLTSGTMMSIAANGASQTSAKYIDIAQTGTTTGFTGSLINLSSTSTTGAATFINLAANSSTVGIGQAISMTSLTTGSALSLTGPTSTGVITGTSSGFMKVVSDVGSGSTAGVLAYFAPDYSGSTSTGYGIKIDGTDSTATNKTNYNLQSNLTMTGNGGKTGYGLYSNVTSDSTSNSYALYGGYFSANATGAISANTRDIYGIYSAPSSSTGASNGGTTNIYGGYFLPTSSDSTTGATVNSYGIFAQANGRLTTGGTLNSYGAYIANSNTHSTGTTTKIGLYVEEPTSGDTNYAAIFAGGNIGVAKTTPSERLNLGDGSDLLLDSGYMYSPQGGFGRSENRIKYTEELDNAAWTKTGVSITANSTTGPDGYTTADTIGAGGSSTDNVKQADWLSTSSTSTTWTGSVWLKKSSGSGTVNLRLDSGNQTGTANTVTVTTSWQRFTVTQAFNGSSTGTVTFIINNGTTAYYAWGAQLEKQSTAGIYVRNGSRGNTNASMGLVVNSRESVGGGESATSNAFTFNFDGWDAAASGYTTGMYIRSLSDVGYAPYHIKTFNEAYDTYGSIATSNVSGFDFSTGGVTTGARYRFSDVSTNFATISNVTSQPGLRLIGSANIKANATSELTGDIDPAASTTVTGSGTAFLTELAVGDRITVTGETRTVTAIASDTSLTVDTAFSNNANDTTPDKLPALLSVIDSSNSPGLIIQNDGRVGIGTAAPDSLSTVDIQKSQNTYSILRVYNNNSGSSASARIALGNDSNAYGGQMIYSSSTETTFGGANSLNFYNGANAPIAFFTNGVNQRVTISGAGGFRIHAFGTGTVSSDASGNLTSSSDIRLKDVQGAFDRGLSSIMAIDPILYRWNALSGLDQTFLNAGFSAQNIQTAIPEAVDTDPQGYLSLSDRPILAALVNATKELNNTSLIQDPKGNVSKPSFTFTVGEQDGQVINEVGGGTIEGHDTSFIINQKDSGNLLQLQKDGMDNFLVANDGTVHINANLASGIVLEITNADTSLFTINTKGTAILTGTLVVKKDVAVLGRILGSTAIVAKNTSNETIHQGDLLMLTGATEEPILGDQPTLTIAKAVAGANTIIVGVADRNLSDFNISPDSPITDDPTTIKPGEYVSIVITGTYKKVFVNGSVSLGDKLTASTFAGKAAKLPSEAQGQVFGISLDSTPDNTGSIRVMLLSTFQQVTQIVQQAPVVQNNTPPENTHQTDPPSPTTEEGGDGAESETPAPEPTPAVDPEPEIVTE